MRLKARERAGLRSRLTLSRRHGDALHHDTATRLRPEHPAHSRPPEKLANPFELPEPPAAQLRSVVAAVLIHSRPSFHLEY